MTPPTDPDYTAQALRTESPITPALQTRLKDHARLVHALLGLQTEAGELADPVKKHIYYGRPLDLVNLREEIGDCLWYLAIAADALGTTLEAEQARNLAKLRARYPHVFTAEAAQVRDLDREREVLEEADVAPPQIVPEVDPNPAEPRMVIWSTLRCLELQIDQHEELYNSNGVVSWELLKHMVRLAKRHAHEEGGKIVAAERETDEWRTRADEANAKLRETEQELDRLRKVHMEFQSEELTQARATIADLQQQLANAQRAVSDAFGEVNSVRQQLDAGTTEPAPVAEPRPCPECERLRAELETANEHRTDLLLFVDKVRKTFRVWGGDESFFHSVSHALYELDTNSSATLTSSVVKESLTPTPVAEPLDGKAGQ